MFLTSEPIDLSALLLEARPSDGGVCLFVGVVRNHGEGRETTGIQYEAYASMAEAEIERILQSVAKRWPQAHLSIRHRTGRLAVGEASVAVLATSPHRREAFAACREAIDLLKARVPIWKKEFHPDGSSAWVDPTKENRSIG
jgi:molybdopterin synthase catalytic subunit